MNNQSSSIKDFIAKKRGQKKENSQKNTLLENITVLESKRHLNKFRHHPDVTNYKQYILLISQDGSEYYVPKEVFSMSSTIKWLSTINYDTVETLTKRIELPLIRSDVLELVIQYCFLYYLESWAIMKPIGMDLKVEKGESTASDFHSLDEKECNDALDENILDSLSDTDIVKEDVKAEECTKNERVVTDMDMYNCLSIQFSIPDEKTMDLFIASHYLGISPLINLCSKKIADNISLLSKDLIYEIPYDMMVEIIKSLSFLNLARFEMIRLAAPLNELKNLKTGEDELNKFNTWKYWKYFQEKGYPYEYEISKGCIAQGNNQVKHIPIINLHCENNGNKNASSELYVVNSSLNFDGEKEELLETKSKDVKVLPNINVISGFLQNLLDAMVSTDESKNLTKTLCNEFGKCVPFIEFNGRLGMFNESWLELFPNVIGCSFCNYNLNSRMGGSISIKKLIKNIDQLIKKRLKIHGENKNNNGIKNDAKEKEHVELKPNNISLAEMPIENKNEIVESFESIKDDGFENNRIIPFFDYPEHHHMFFLSLSLRNCSLSDDEIHHISLSLKKGNSLEYLLNLDLSLNLVSSIGFIKLLDGARNGNLEKLILKGNRVGKLSSYDKETKIIKPPPLFNKQISEKDKWNLKQLDLSSNFLGKNNLVLKSTSWINVQNGHIISNQFINTSEEKMSEINDEKEEMKAVFKWLPISLEELNLSSNPLSRSSYLWKRISSLENLKILDLSWSLLANEDLESIIPCFLKGTACPVSKSLECLGLGNIRGIGEAGWDDIWQSSITKLFLEHTDKLKALDVSSPLQLPFPIEQLNEWIEMCSFELICLPRIMSENRNLNKPPKVKFRIADECLWKLLKKPDFITNQ